MPKSTKTFSHPSQILNENAFKITTYPFIENVGKLICSPLLMKKSVLIQIYVFLRKYLFFFVLLCSMKEKKIFLSENLLYLRF